MKHPRRVRLRCGAPDRARTGRACGATLAYALPVDGPSVSLTADRAGLRPAALARDFTNGPWSYFDVMVCPRCGAQHPLPSVQREADLAARVDYAQRHRADLFAGSPGYGVVLP